MLIDTLKGELVNQEKYYWRNYSYPARPSSSSGEILPKNLSFYYCKTYTGLNLQASHAVVSSGGGNTSPLQTTAWEVKSILD